MTLSLDQSVISFESTGLRVDLNDARPRHKSRMRPEVSAPQSPSSLTQMKHTRGTRGYFGYRYQRRYYRTYLPHGANPSGFGQQFADGIPREPSAFQDWMHKKIRMLENSNASSEEALYHDGSVDESGLGYERDCDWTFVDDRIQWTYVIDLDNRVFTINGTKHLRLDNMPPSYPGLQYYYDEKQEIPSQHLASIVDLWPAPRFDVEKRQKEYDALCPIIVPVAQWGALTWDKLTVSQRFSITLANHILHYIPDEIPKAYAKRYRRNAGRFCWDLLCAATPAVPIAHHREPDYKILAAYERPGSKPERMIHKTGARGLKSFATDNNGDYCWVRGRLIAFCLRLSDQAYVIHEVEQMVQKMRHDGHDDCVGIILSSQQEMVAVAVEDISKPTRKVRHTPVLDIRRKPGKPEQASDGLLLLVHLLSPLLTVPRLPWDASRPHRTWSQTRLPVEIIQRIAHCTDTRTYLALSRVSKLIHSVCTTNPRVAQYTILKGTPEFECKEWLSFACRYRGDDKSDVLKMCWGVSGPCPQCKNSGS